MSIIIKNEDQIEGIRKSCHLAIDTLDWVEQWIKPGVTTEQINQEADSYIRKYGGIPACLGYLGFPKSICTSINEVICHGIPSETVVLKEGDIINVDVTAILDGYYGDTSRMYAVGNVSEEAQKIMTCTRDALEIGILQVKPGNRFGDIGKAITQYAHSKGYSVVYQFCGHGTGIKFHEEPTIHHDDRKYDKTEMKPGMVFTIEPMLCERAPHAMILEDRWTAVTTDGGLSAQYEHTILVTDGGFEILTR